ncbi:MAG: D-2-hydroxyacid dehydrogenase [Candidatus Eisenbacteria bacterium]|nr:D-2-hydroxyacid dehydrogenase [Candidatus Eisenbacteria bacterium]
MNSARVLVVREDSAAVAAALRLEFPEVEFAAAPVAEELPDGTLEHDVLVSFQLPAAWVPRLPCLRWVHSPGAGVDRIVGATGLPPGVRITRTCADFGRQIGEFVLAALMDHATQAPRWRAAVAARRWDRDRRPLACGRRALVVGLGDIGGAVAELLRAAGFEVHGVSRGGRAHAACARVTAMGGLDGELSEADYVVLALPLTPGTCGMFHAGRLSRLRPSAVLVNVARAEVVEEAALAAALDSGALAAAYLDVLWREPPAAADPWWTRRNVTLTPHIAGVTETGALVTEFRENLRRYLRGEPLLNEVDRALGY